MEVFQEEVAAWTRTCFGNEVATNKTERAYRFLEESLELAQSCGLSRDECNQLLDYVFGRDIGEIYQEVGGVMVTIAALCQANGIDLKYASYDELTRCWANIRKIRDKWNSKQVKVSPLP